MERPKLPSLSASTGYSLTSRESNIRTLPPLSHILNNDNITSTSNDSNTNSSQSPTESTPTSPIEAITRPVIQTPVRLPSLESFKFSNRNESKPKLMTFPPTPQTLPPPTLPLVPVMASSTTPSKILPTRIPSTSSIITNTAGPVPIPMSVPVPMVTPTKLQKSAPTSEKKLYAFISHSPSTYPSQEPSIDNAQLARRKRRRTSPNELQILQDEFLKGQTPNKARRIDIAKRVNMNEKAVQIWFQNKRQTLRKQSASGKEVHHIEPIYLPPQPTATIESMRYNYPQPMINQLPPIAKTSPQLPSAAVIEPSTTHSQQQLYQTPNRSNSEKELTTSPTGGSKITFRLNKSSPQSSSPSVVPTPEQSGLTNQGMQPYKQRQKPVMRVNPTIPKSSPDATTKENVSPNSSPIKSQSTTETAKAERIPLKELSFNSSNKPKTENSAVKDLLNIN